MGKFDYNGYVEQVLNGFEKGLLNKDQAHDYIMEAIKKDRFSLTSFIIGTFAGVIWSCLV